MSEINGIKQAAFQDAEANRHRFEMRKVAETNAKEYQAKVSDHDATMERMNKEFEKEESVEKMNLERELNFIRAKFAELKRKENERFESEIRDLKKAHEDQKTEMINSQSEEIIKTEKSHKNFIDNARRKFQEEKAKYEMG